MAERCILAPAVPVNVASVTFWLMLIGGHVPGCLQRLLLLLCADFCLNDLCQRQAALDVRACLAKLSCLICLPHHQFG